MPNTPHTCATHLQSYAYAVCVLVSAVPYAVLATIAFAATAVGVVVLAITKPLWQLSNML
jgi:hypothetical protein